MQTIINILVFIIIFGSIILIHELGHLLVAKFFGVYCPKYSIGFGPVLFHKQIGETDYELRCIPFGGFVMMAGEGDETYEDQVSEDRLLTNKKTYQKICIYLAGVASNFITAIIVMLIVFCNTSIVPIESNKIGDFTDNSILKESGLEVNDLLESIYVSENNQTYSIDSILNLNLNKESIGTYDKIHITVTYLHDDSEYTKNCIVEYNEDEDKYLLGIYPETTKPTFFKAIQYTFEEFTYLATVIVSSFISLFTNFFTNVKQFTGPAGIYQQTATLTASGDTPTLFYFWSLLCINIGVFNLFPIPGLDGYQVLVALIEKVIHKEISPTIKQYLSLIGMTFVIMLMVIITLQDLF